LEREELWRTPVSAAEDLWYRGWVQRAFAEREIGQVAMAFVPDELRLYIPPPPPLVLPPLTATQSPLHADLGNDDLAENLVTFWLDVQLGGTDTTVPLLDKRQRDFLKILSLEQGWVRQEADGNLRLVPEPVVAWLQATVWEQWSSLAQAWMDSSTWNELAHSPTLRPDPLKGWPKTSVIARQCVLDMLRRCEPEQWYTIADLVTYMHTHATDFLRPDGDYDTWELRSIESDAPLRGFGAWAAVEGAFITFMLTGPLAWLGMVDLGRISFTHPLTTFRLSAAGAGILGLVDAPTFPVPSQLRCLADGLLVVPLRRRYERFQLGRVAQVLTSSTKDVWHYRFTPKSLMGAQQQHIALSRIFDFLIEASGQALPVQLHDALESGYTGRAQASLKRVCLLRVVDEAVLALPTVQPFIQEQLGPSAVLIREGDYTRVLATLTRQGILANFEK